MIVHNIVVFPLTANDSMHRVAACIAIIRLKASSGFMMRGSHSLMAGVTWIDGTSNTKLV